MKAKTKAELSRLAARITAAETRIQQVEKELATMRRRAPRKAAKTAAKRSPAPRPKAKRALAPRRPAKAPAQTPAPVRPPTNEFG